MGTIPDDVDTDVRMLIISMLEKDASKRPSIWDLANMKCISTRITELVEQLDCKEQVASVFDYKENKRIDDGEEAPIPMFDLEKLDMIGHLIRSDVRI